MFPTENATLLVATGNAHKTGEIRSLLQAHFSTFEDLRDHPGLPEPEETGLTFEENAIIKALSASVALPGAFVLADDSGIEVDALGGAPGVRSARFSGPGATDATNRAKLLADLEGLGLREAAPVARFRCVLAVARGGMILATFDGAIEGTLRASEAGDGGFGYDPLFQPEGCLVTFGEMSSEEKHALSHRGRALGKFKAWLENPTGAV